MRLFVIFLAAVISSTASRAQQTTLAYDGMSTAMEGQLLAATVFDNEMQVVFNARFSPTEKCILDAVELGFGVVKFTANSGEDTLVVWVYEAGATPPQLKSVVKTYLFPLGDRGVPRGNVAMGDPFASGAREARTFVLNPPVIFAPKRDFIVGVMLRSLQRHVIPNAVWNGFSVLVRKDSPEFSRYGRYAILEPPYPAKNPPVTEASRASLFLRAVVQYDPTLPDTPLTDYENPATANRIELGVNYPNPFSDVTEIPFMLSGESRVVLTLHDVLGREVARVRDGRLLAGAHTAVLDAASARLAAGLYVLRLAGDRHVATRKVICKR